ncbi:hypothetical protein F5J12DRAFT_814370 [Pisolithus orientalis]|uniref:uncharacterized protein n=1 Tax=Pisolithus orientalis TaxID=936130 RepID=UPI00222522F1|nr:uncharacterized protein F5J12DRAFT_814370 [Pisolithus orientalis]KAI6019955.1 hypothetical protein F5J12DRAFT_814370 [Pisolithus orientalis]
MWIYSHVRVAEEPTLLPPFGLLPREVVLSSAVLNMPYASSIIFASLVLVLGYVHARHIDAYTPQSAPYQTWPGQSGYNQCGTSYNQSSECQNVYLNNVQDFCLWAPPYPGSTIGDTEQVEVAWCMQSGYGTRLIPDGTITGAHLVVTPDYVQITGVGNLTNINILNNDQGGELDYYGAAGGGYPVGGLVFSSAFGQLQQVDTWTSFISYDLFCFRACKPSVNASTLCQYAYSVMGCEWNMPANYSAGVFEECVGDSGQPMGVYGTSTFSQGQPTTPAPLPMPPSSSCTFYSTITNGQGVLPSGAASTRATEVPITPVSSSDYTSFQSESSSFSTTSMEIISTGPSSSLQTSVPLLSPLSDSLTSSATHVVSTPPPSSSSTPPQCPPGYLTAIPSRGANLETPRAPALMSLTIVIATLVGCAFIL